MSFQPSRYQSAIFEWIQKGSGSAIVEAVAGSGKTTTCAKAVSLIPRNQSTLFLAFNKSIADELRKRVPQHVQCMTLNALGHRAVYKALGRIQLDAYKTRAIMDQLVEDGFAEQHEIHSQGGTIKRMVDVAKAVGLVPEQFISSLGPRHAGLNVLVKDTLDNWMDLIEHFDIDVGYEPERLIEIAQDVLARSLSDRARIDYNDQLYMPVVLNLPMPQFDFVFVDEAQDVSAIQRNLIYMALKKSGRLVAVGDSRQAIYGFRGADSDSLENIARVFNCIRLPLSISYRCPKLVIQEAQKLVPEIEHHESAPDGVIERLGEYKAHMFQAGDLVVCRNSKPVIQLAYFLLSNRKTAKVMGRDIGTGLVGLIKRLRAHDIEGLCRKLADWKAKETKRLLAKDPEADLSSVEDKYDCIMCFIECTMASSIPELISAIESLFSEGNKAGAIMLSTIHRAKGLEADRVFFLDSHLCPSKYAQQDHQIEQEENLIYVAITRAKSELMYITTPRDE